MPSAMAHWYPVYNLYTRAAWVLVFPKLYNMMTRYIAKCTRASLVYAQQQRQREMHTARS